MMASKDESALQERPENGPSEHVPRSFLLFLLRELLHAGRKPAVPVPSRR